MAAKRDLYMILQVAPVAKEDEIRKAYRMLSKKYHPDLNPDARQYSEDKMRELVEAYNVLSVKEKRKEYDNQPHLQIKRFIKGQKKHGTDAAAFSKKPTYEREGSLLDRILSPFLKKKDGDSMGPIKVDHKQSDVHFTLGLTMAENEAFYDQAKNEFKTSLRFDPGASDALYNLALMCYKLGEFEEAKVHFQKYLSIARDDPMAKKMITLLSEEF